RHLTSPAGSLINPDMYTKSTIIKKICILVFSAAAAWAVAPAAAAGGPTAVAENPVHDFGTVSAGSEVFHSFVIENTGDEDLLLKSVRAG
ncbi:MAG: DUF1573 domain-containing protein, partial [Desulfobacterales bacterium]